MQTVIASWRRVAMFAAISSFVLALVVWASSAGWPLADEAESGILAGDQFVQTGSRGLSSNPLAGLPLIPWEGGPAYWKQFSRADAAGWDDPSFFPIANFATGVQTQADIDKDKAVGLNTYAGPCCAIDPLQQMSLIRDNGMFVVSTPEFLSGAGAETVGWYLIDEPSQFCGGQPDKCVQAKIKEAYDAIKTASPDDGRFTLSNFTSDLILPNYIRRTAQAEMNTYNNVVSADNYWYTFSHYCGGAAGGEIWQDGSGGSQPHGNGYPNLSREECHRSANYGYSLDAMRNISSRNLSEPKVSIWNFIENSHPSEYDTEPSIQAGQLSGAVMSSVIHEARGIIYFNRNFGHNGITANNPCSDQEPFRDCPGAYGDAIRADAKKVNSQLTALAPIINTQSYEYTFDPTLQTMLKWYNGLSLHLCYGSSQEGRSVYRRPYPYLAVEPSSSHKRRGRR